MKSKSGQGIVIDFKSPHKKRNLMVVTSPQKTKINKFISWAGTCTSALCAIHCFGTALIAVISPSLLKIFPHSASLEKIVLLISMVTAILTLKRLHAKLIPWLTFAACSSVGITGIVFHIHGLLGASLASLAIIQLAYLWKTHHPQKGESAPDCCQHET